ncbi:MAG TPA: gamma-glutamyl-gamma-aminobutyrate hydrolase family protein [Terriglobales bacterium]|nr:gamma-glutamyl-gamma-aminobutyrate hydrolase family protein [Terriglobales bacterium]
MSKPIILYSCHWEPTVIYGKPFLGLTESYLDSIELCGAIPVMVPYCKNTDNLDRYIEMADGCVFTGGYDVDTEIYGEQPKYNTVVSTFPRDRHEEALYKKWMATGKPTLGICRGLQFINAMEGGTLHQDIPVERSTIHSSTEHFICLEEGGILEEIFGKDDLKVNSFHHQCIKRLADTLKVTAYSKDDYIIEGVQHKSKPMFAVQFHPERQCGTWCEEGLTHMEPLFDKFVEMCQSKK